MRTVHAPRLGGDLPLCGTAGATALSEDPDEVNCQRCVRWVLAMWRTKCQMYRWKIEQKETA